MALALAGLRKSTGLSVPARPWRLEGSIPAAYTPGYRSHGPLFVFFVQDFRRKGLTPHGVHYLKQPSIVDKWVPPLPNDTTHASLMINFDRCSENVRLRRLAVLVTDTGNRLVFADCCR